MTNIEILRSVQEELNKISEVEWCEMIHATTFYSTTLEPLDEIGRIELCVCTGTGGGKRICVTSQYDPKHHQFKKPQIKTPYFSADRSPEAIAKGINTKFIVPWLKQREEYLKAEEQRKVDIQKARRLYVARMLQILKELGIHPTTAEEVERASCTTSIKAHRRNQALASIEFYVDEPRGDIFEVSLRLTATEVKNLIRYLRREGLIELDGYSIAGGLPKHLLE
jgi:hypothetical protein